MALQKREPTSIKVEIDFERLERIAESINQATVKLEEATEKAKRATVALSKTLDRARSEQRIKL